MSTTTETPSTKTKPCDRCGNSFDYRPVTLFGREMDVAPSYCDSCDELAITEKRRALADDATRKSFENAEARRIRWNAICPPRFGTTDLNHPSMKTKSVRDALAWQYGERGLLMHGETETCKSRVLWEHCRRAFVNEGRSVEVFAATDFAFQLTKAFADNSARYPAFIERLRATDILALDDLGKEKMTERVQSELFGLIDWRVNFCRPILITTNYVRESLIARFLDQETAIPLVGRLLANCDRVAMVPARVRA